MEVCTYAAPLISRPVQDAAHNVDKIVNKVADNKVQTQEGKREGCTDERRIKKLRQHGLIKYNQDKNKIFAKAKPSVKGGYKNDESFVVYP